MAISSATFEEWTKVKLDVLQSPYEFLLFGPGTEEVDAEEWSVVNWGDDFPSSHHSK